MVETSNARGTPPMVTVMVVVVPQFADAVCRSVTDWPSLRVPAAVTKAPASIW